MNKKNKELINEFREKICPKCTCYMKLCQEQTDQHIINCPSYFNYKLVGRPNYPDWFPQY